MIKICHIGTHGYMGGAEVFLKSLAIKLKKTEIAKSLIIGNIQDNFKQEMPFPVSTGTYKDILQAQKDFDLIIHWGNLPFNDIFVNKNIKSVFFAFTEMSKTSFLNCDKKASHVVAVSQKIKESIKTDIPLSLLWTPVDVKRLNCDMNQKAAREFFGIYDDSFVVGYAGSLLKIKNLNILIESIDYMIGTKILILGEGPELHNLDKKNPNVIFHKHISEIGIFYKAINAFCLCSSSEGGPNVLWESLACGIPFIGTPVGIIPEIIENKKNGLIIDWNSKSIVEAVNFLKNKDNYMIIKNNSKNTSTEKGDFNTCVNQIENIFINTARRKIFFL